MDFISIFFTDPVSRYSNFFILGLFAFCLIRNQTRIAQDASTLLTSLGILGTFLGILFALDGFDSQNIDTSIPLLLDGLRLAFSTSVMGMATSVLYKFARPYLPSGKQSEEGIKDGVTPSDIHAELQNISKTLGGTQDASLITQIGQLRNDVRDGNERMVTALDTFGQELARVSTETIVETLREVVNNFNQLIQEQFGENFKELNQAVTGLVDWMDKYKDHVESLEKRLVQATEGIERTDKSVQSIKGNTEAIPVFMEKLKGTIAALDAQREDLEQRLKAFEDLKENAINAFPVIQQSIMGLTDDYRVVLNQHSQDISDLLSQTNDKLRQTIDTSTDAITNHLETQTQKWSALADASFQGIEAAHNAHDIAAQNLQKASSEHAEAVRNTADQVTQQLKQAVDDINITIEKSFESFDDAMQGEVKRVIEQMGSQLASLSKKFVDDYTPLTQQLHRLVQVANNGGKN